MLSGPYPQRWWRRRRTASWCCARCCAQPFVEIRRYGAVSLSPRCDLFHAAAVDKIVHGGPPRALERVLVTSLRTAPSERPVVVDIDLKLRHLRQIVGAHGGSELSRLASPISWLRSFSSVAVGCRWPSAQRCRCSGLCRPPRRRHGRRWSHRGWCSVLRARRAMALAVFASPLRSDQFSGRQTPSWRSAAAAEAEAFKW